MHRDLIEKPEIGEEYPADSQQHQYDDRSFQARERHIPDLMPSAAAIYDCRFVKRLIDPNQSGVIEDRLVAEAHP